jgi:hypothetical protein
MIQTCEKKENKNATEKREHQHEVELTHCVKIWHLVGQTSEVRCRENANKERKQKQQDKKTDMNQREQKEAKGQDARQ